MNKLPASAGWDWIRQGFALFRQQPGGLFMIQIAYMLMFVVLGLIPILGQIVPVALAPVFSAIFLQACLNIDRGARIEPRLLPQGFRAPGVPTLVLLGLLYIMIAAIALGISMLADGGALLKMVTEGGQPDPKELAESGIGGALLLAMLIYLPAMMAFWFTVPLVSWQHMGLFKALFYSFFSVWHALKAFLVFLLSLFGILLLSVQLILLLFGTGGVGTILMLMLWMMLIILIHCALYASYRQVFGAPEELPPV